MFDNNPPADPYADAPQYPPPSDSRSAAGRGRERSRSASPAARPRSPPRRRSPPPRPRGIPNPQPSSTLGVFGLSIRTQERDLDEEFSRFGKVEKVTIVYDQRSDRSRGFGFIKMSTPEEAARCITELNGLDLNGRRIRVDYSTTERPHAPTPGEYMGHRRPEYEERRRRDDRDSHHGRDWKDRRDHRDRDREYRDRDRDHRDRDRDRRSPRRSPSPSHRRKRSYSRSPPRGSSPTRERREEGGGGGGGRW
ncbi:transformer-2 protein-like alpha (TRA-2 alpha)-like RNA recognition motif protein [Rhizoctonia solani 123E]|uniref:Transformer-2 protein-like alpha (TRA-2 alpha)-like RNA recognition motif protein n=1 Tax=Rhizoctonia solani 123E TaxID=1423351 RepID=A0A074S7B0_9AGAM|nr:transformer-2 protein-like alpha (TRA-2 alpha)-like RNA recognition motif protein [Rhizoctonia solani 123E]